MQLLELITQSKSRSIAVVGLAKNAGKTVALNSIIRQSAKAGLLLGLSSIGYDGEKVDLVSRLPKPRIEVPEGTILATAVATLERATAGLEILASTNFVTALGEVMLVRARESGFVEIAGPDSYSEMGECIARMQQLGCALTLIDGALDRVGSAAPSITEGAIMATGAVAGTNMRRILARTLHVVSLFSLPQMPEGVRREAARGAMHEGKIALITARARHFLPFHTALGHAAAVVAALPRQEDFYLVVPGAITESLLGELNSQPGLCKHAALVCPDPTHIFSSPEVWQRFVGRGGRVEVMQGIRLLAATVNPVAPGGKSYPPKEFAAELAQTLAPLPVFDLFVSEERVTV